MSTSLSGEVVILGLDDGIYYGLDGCGARIWELVQEPAALRDVAEILSREFVVDRERALRDLLALAHEFHARGLLDVAPDAAA